MNNPITPLDTAPPWEIKAAQEIRLQEQLRYLNTYSPFYSALFQQHQIDVAAIRTLEDLAHLPLTSKDDLQQHGNDFLCVPKEKIVDYVTTSGTLGEPVVFALTNNDLERLAYNEFLSLSCAGGLPQDIYQLMVTLDKRFMAGLAYFMGIRRMGAAAIRTGVGSPAFQLDTIQRLQPTVLVAVPSFVVKLLEVAAATNIDLRKSSVQKIVCIGEPIRNADFSLNALGKRIWEQWPIPLFSTYASTEMSTAFTECKAGRGGHHLPELIIVEVLDENGQQVSNGEAGEVTITTLGVEAMPLLRFKTGDICHLHTEACSCGRTTLRLGPVIGRKQQMIKYKGTTLYPPALFEVLNKIPAVEDYIIILSLDAIGMDSIRVELVTADPSETIKNRIAEDFRRQIRVVPELVFVTNDYLQLLKFPPMARKAVRLIDKRKA